MLRDESFREDKLEEFRNNYKKVLLSEDEYFLEFSKRMDEAL